MWVYATSQRYFVPVRFVDYLEGIVCIAIVVTVVVLVKKECLYFQNVETEPLFQNVTISVFVVKGRSTSFFMMVLTNVLSLTRYFDGW